MLVDYGCYYQATIFTTLDGSGKGMDAQYRDPRYHPFAHPILWTIATVGLVSLFLMLALGISNEASAYAVAGAAGAFFFTLSSDAAGHQLKVASLRQLRVESCR